MKIKTDIFDTHRLPGIPDYFALIKFRLLSLVLVSVCMGFYLSASADASLTALSAALLGVFCVGGGANALNQWAEKDIDALMWRTRFRPLPAKRLTADHALLFGLLISLSGFAIIGLLINPLTLLLSFLSWASYLFIYTPMKRRTPLNTWVGAFPGALPVVLGSTTALGTISPAAVVLFAILFIWQMPHFFAISWVHRDDYLRGGFRMLSWNDQDGSKTRFQILLYTVLLLPAAAALFLIGEASYIYLLISGLAGLVFLYLAIKFYLSRELNAARKVFHFSIIYLPLLFLAIIADRTLGSF